MPKERKKSSFLHLLKKFQGQLFSNILTVALVSLLVKGIGFFKEIIIADTYGVSELLDTYLIAVLVPTFVQNVFLSSYNSVFIPNYVLEKKQGQDVGAFQSSSFFITIILALLMMGITYLGIDVYLEVLFPGHEAQYYGLIKAQLWLVLPCMLFWGITSLVAGLLMVDDEFLHSSINAIFVPLITIVFLIFFQQELQEKTLAMGMLVGSILSFLYVVVAGFKKKVIHISRPNLKSKNIQILLKQFPAKISSGLIMGLTPMVDQFFSAQLAIGAIAALNYGNKIPLVVLSLISVSIGNTLLPYFSKKATEGQKKLYEYLHRVLGSVLAILSILAILLILLSRFIIETLFERGSFTATDTEQVYVIQQMFLIQLPFYISAIVMNKYLTAINRNNFLVVSSLASLVLNIIFNYILIQIMGIKGIALATSFIYLGNALLIYIYIRRINRIEVSTKE